MFDEVVCEIVNSLLQDERDDIQKDENICYAQSNGAQRGVDDGVSPPPTYTSAAAASAAALSKYGLLAYNAEMLLTLLLPQT